MIWQGDAAHSGQPAWGWSSAPAPPAAPSRPLSLQEIQEQEERERKAREAKAAAAAAAARANAYVPGPAWGGHAAAKPPIAAAQQPATAKRQTAALPAAIDDHSGLLWDYGAPAPETRPAPAPAPPRQPTSNGATPFPTLSPVDAQPPTKSKKKKGKAEEAPSPANNGRREPADEGETFDLDGGQMPPSMARWCKEQMMALTGNDDTTLTQFLFTLQNDGEVESYLSVYLGAHPPPSLRHAPFLFFSLASQAGLCRAARHSSAQLGLLCGVQATPLLLRASPR
eukprot:6192138-Pleurochrysis_carterae.AAC.1